MDKKIVSVQIYFFIQVYKSYQIKHLHLYNFRPFNFILVQKQMVYNT